MTISPPMRRNAAGPLGQAERGEGRRGPPFVGSAPWAGTGRVREVRTPRLGCLIYDAGQSLSLRSCTISSCSLRSLCVRPSMTS